MNPIFLALLSILVFLFANFLTETSAEKRKTSDDRYPTFDILITQSQPHQRLLLCPAYTKVEKELNDAFSLGRNSLFTIDRITDSFSIKIPNICHNPIKPVIIYNLVDQQYEVGYELYIEERISEPKFPVNKNYQSFAPTNENDEILNSTELEPEMSSSSSLKYQDGEWTIIKMNAEPYRPRIFHFKSELYFKHREFNKMTQREISIVDVEDDDLLYECPGDSLEDSILQIYSARNQEACLMDIETPARSPETSNQPETSFLQIQNRNPTSRKLPFGYLAKSQIIPSWYFHTSWSKKASCTRLNIVPIWKIIAEGQLKKVDLYLLAAEYQLRRNENYLIAGTIFGVGGILNLPDMNNSSIFRERYLWDFESRHSRKIPIPKIIYRIFALTSGDNRRYSVAIIIHNILTDVPDTKRICSPGSQPTGWGRIENNDTSIGLTYTCPLTSQVLTKLGLFEDTNMFAQDDFLRLDMVPNCLKGYKPRSYEESDSWLDDSNWDFESKLSTLAPCPSDIVDETSRINAEFERFLNLVQDNAQDIC